MLRNFESFIRDIFWKIRGDDETKTQIERRYFKGKANAAE